MDTKKLLLSALAGFVGMFVVGNIFYSFIFADYFAKAWENVGMRSEEEMIMWAFVVGYLGLALLMAFIYPKGYTGGSPAVEGVRYGILIGLLITFPVDFMMYGYLPVPLSSLFVDMAIFIITAAIGGLLIGLVYGKTETAEQPEAAT